MVASPGLDSRLCECCGFLQGKHLGCKAGLLGGRSCLLLGAAAQGPSLETMAAPMLSQGTPSFSDQH